jgi:hypothetical protein
MTPRVCVIVFILTWSAFSYTTLAQSPDPRSFFPHHLGDIWQYRYNSSNFIAYTAIVRRESLDVDGNEYVFMPMGGAFRIDTTLNVNAWNEFSEPPSLGALSYQLDADSGDSWIVEDFGSPMVGQVISVFEPP